MVSVTQYVAQDGKVPFQRWFSSLSTEAALKVRTAIAQMEMGNLGDHKSVGAGVWERRIHFERGYRVYFAKDGDELVVLLCGGTKARQQSDINEAKKYWLEYKKRKKQDKKEQESPMNARQKKKRK